MERKSIGCRLKGRTRCCRRVGQGFDTTLSFLLGVFSVVSGGSICTPDRSWPRRYGHDREMGKS